LAIIDSIFGLFTLITLNEGILFSFLPLFMLPNMLERVLNGYATRMAPLNFERGFERHAKVVPSGTFSGLYLCLHFAAIDAHFREARPGRESLGDAAELPADLDKICPARVENFLFLEKLEIAI
jgi:hypothetical protein